jgi:ribosomal protein S15P/S13E
LQKSAGPGLKVPAFIILFILLYWYSAVIKIPLKTDKLPDRGVFNFKNSLEMEYLFSPGAGRVDENKPVYASLAFKCTDTISRPVEKGLVNVFLAIENADITRLTETVNYFKEHISLNKKDFSSNIDINFITPCGLSKDLKSLSDSSDQSLVKSDALFQRETFFEKTEQALARTKTINYKYNLFITDFRDALAARLSKLIKNYQDVKTVFLKSAEPCDFLYDFSGEYFFADTSSELSKSITLILTDLPRIGFQRVNLSIENNGNIDITDIYGAEHLVDGNNRIVLLNKILSSKKNVIILKLRFKKPYAGLNSMFTVKAESIPAVIGKNSKTSVSHSRWIKSYLFLPKESKFEVKVNDEPLKTAELFAEMKRLWIPKNSKDQKTREKISEITKKLRVKKTLNLKENQKI